MKTGTTTLGIVCKDGIVLAADRRATSGNYIMDKDIQKVFEITPHIAITTAGSVSDIQLLLKLIKAELRLKSIRNDREISVKEAANLLAGLVFDNIRRSYMVPAVSQFLLAGADSTGFYLYDIFPDGSLTQKKDYTSSGSGSVMVFGVLETMYDPNVTMEKAVDLALKAENAAMQRDSASGNGIDVITITKDGIKWVVRKDMTPKL